VRELDWGAPRAADLARRLFPGLTPEAEEALATTAAGDFVKQKIEAREPMPKVATPTQTRVRSRVTRLLPLVPLVIIVGAVLIARRNQVESHGLPKPAPLATAPPTQPPAPPPKPVLPANVNIDVRSSPSEADVFLDDDAAPRRAARRRTC
jgi:hypothetical protein